MYQAYDFTYAGMSASMFGMFICDIDNHKHVDNQFGNKANIIEDRIAGRIKPLHYGVRYNDEPLTFTLIFGSENEMDRFQIQEIAQWLTGYQDYQWLSIDQPDLEHVQFRCLIESLTPISVGWVPVAFEANVVCDCPYAYGYPFQYEYRTSSGLYRTAYNDGTPRELLKPNIRIAITNGRSFSIENRTTGETMSFTDLPRDNMVIDIDTENCILTYANAAAGDTGLDIYSYLNKNGSFVFLGLQSGDNELVFTGSGSVTISGRFLYNVGA